MPIFDRLGNDMTDDINDALADEQAAADKAHDALIATLVQAVRDYAIAHYNEGGWDMVVECYERSEIAEAIQGCTTPEEAIERLGEAAGIYHDRRLDAWRAGGLDEHGRLPDDGDLSDDYLIGGDDLGPHTCSLPEDEEGFSPEQEAREDEEGARWGDPRRCPHHPHVVIGSPCGMFDGVCGECEHGGDEEPEETDLDTPPWERCAPEAAVSRNCEGAEAVWPHPSATRCESGLSWPPIDRLGNIHNGWGCFINDDDMIPF